ncbi:hypothetical protein JW877_10425 [bacterium]|nr:hypothetical protein [bacterium]
MKLKTLIWIIIFAIAGYIVYVNFFEPGEGDKELPPPREGYASIRIHNLTTSLALFNMDGILHRVDPSSSKVIQKVSTGPHIFRCSYVNLKGEQKHKYEEIILYGNITITIDPKSGVNW